MRRLFSEDKYKDDYEVGVRPTMPHHTFKHMHDARSVDACELQDMIFLQDI